MLQKFKPSLREASPWLTYALRIADASIVSLLIVPIVSWHGVPWADHYEIMMVLSFCMSFVLFHFFSLYRPWRGQDIMSELRNILTAWVVLACLVLLLLFVFKVAHTYSRAVILTWFVVTPVALCLMHGAFRKILRFVRARGKNQRTAVIVGAGDLGRFLARYMEDIPWAGIRVIGFFDDKRTTGDLQEDDHDALPVLGTISELSKFLAENDVDFVYIALPLRAEQKIHEILNSCRTLGARIFLVPDLYAFNFFNTRLQSLGDVLLLDFNPESQAKRVFDVVFSLLVILATLPVTLLIALIIKMHDRGPVFYGHRRITCTGRDFFCLKFRTMHKDADKKLADILENDPEARQEWEKTFKLKKDPRVTPIGRFLRKTSLDELPQFINVLKGDMSVVGARPIVNQELCNYYKDKAGLYCSLKPGVTGLWQVNKRSDTEDYDERVSLDTWYVLNRSFVLDMQLIIKTVWCMVRGKGAY
jgi:exopolysaccharide biosynthesis polyprenyl glycosylphosphotransferase